VTSSSNLGGPRIGLLYSSNGGTSWSELSQGLPATSIVGVAARGSTILAAASEPLRQAAAGGLYRSTDAGASFQAVTFGSGVGNVAVTARAAGPSHSRRTDRAAGNRTQRLRRGRALYDLQQQQRRPAAEPDAVEGQRP